MINNISKSHGNPIINFLIILLTNQPTNYASRLYNRIVHIQARLQCATEYGLQLTTEKSCARW